MTVDPADQAVKAVWRGQGGEPNPVSLADVRQRADRFERKVRARNLREYAATVVVVLGFGWEAWVFPGWMIKLGCLLVIAGAVFVVWRLRRDGSASRARLDGPSQALIDFYRSQLVRQRDLLRTVWSWYLAPFVPGMVLMGLGRWFQFHAPRRPVAFDHLVIVLCSIIVTLFFVIVWLLNALGAARLQKQIDELDVLREE